MVLDKSRRVIDIKDVITFQGKTVEEARQAFEDSVDDYLEWCEESGEEPNKPFSGKLPFRTKQKIIAKFLLRPVKRVRVLTDGWTRF